ncbi:hypothetical protein V7159_10570 [Priestia megaterium]|uniref:hypothetical protein n=1 Tax=Priestia megaterium TaxID=1404 RepID=UPI00300B9559
MMNFFTRKTKAIETSQKDFDKLNNEVETLEATQAELTQQIEQINSAMNVISATLLIDSSDKNALATKTKGEKQIEKFKAELADTQEKLSKANEKRVEAQVDLNQAQGEKARAEALKQATGQKAVYKALKVMEKVEPSDVIQEQINLAQAYGLQTSPIGVSKEDDFIRSITSEDNPKAEQQSEEVAREALQAMVDVFEKHGIKFADNAIHNFESVGVELKNK